MKRAGAVIRRRGRRERGRAHIGCTRSADLFPQAQQTWQVGGGGVGCKEEGGKGGTLCAKLYCTRDCGVQQAAVLCVICAP